jgi:hypothetical protein
VAILPVLVDMPEKNNFLLLFLFIVTVFSLFSALMPVLDIDADGYSDSLVTEGFLLISIVSVSIARLHLSTKFAPGHIASPWLLSLLLILPPIITS